MQILLLEALKANRCDYVRVLIDRGIDLQMIDLPELYEQVCCSLYLDHWFFYTCDISRVYNFLICRLSRVKNVNLIKQIVSTCNGY